MKFVLQVVGLAIAMWVFGLAVAGLIMAALWALLVWVIKPIVGVLADNADLVPVGAVLIGSFAWTLFISRDILIHERKEPK